MTHHASNPILSADSYKASHYLQYPPNTTRVSSYIESRGGEYQDTLFFGLQAYLMQQLASPVTQGDVDEAAELLPAHGLTFHKAGWQHIVDKHGGYLPLVIEAVPEGTVLPTQQVLLQVQNTDSACFWLTSYMETALLRAVWYPVTVATLSLHGKRIIRRYLEETADSIEGLPFKLHDFGARGVSSGESAAIGGAAHLVNFMGSDTLSAIKLARHIYQAPMAGFSIPAAEHSTITSWAREGEVDAYRNMLRRFGGAGKLVAVVSDSYDLFHAIDVHWGQTLKAEIESMGGTLVVRPDSGDPVTIVCEAMERLMAKFGSAVNKKGYRVLPPCVRVIQGDGVNLKSIEAILEALKQRQISADNIAFGMGGELLQKVNRDTLKFAMKCSAAEVGGTYRDVYKDPVTDAGKRSKRGRLALVSSEGAKGKPQYETVRAEALGSRPNVLREVYRDGKLLISDSLADIRARAERHG
jgi:nicotinamide phosphoribosyltransferase